MRLVSIQTKRYRTLDGATIRFCKNYCTISGQNNAGKSSVIRLLSALFRPRPSFPWSPSEGSFNFNDDKTQWLKDSAPIEISYSLSLTRDEDPALIAFIEKMASRQIQSASTTLCISYVIAESDAPAVSMTIDDKPVDDKAAKEIDKRIKDSNLLFLYNSTTPHEQYYFGGGRRRLFYEFVMSEEEKRALSEAAKHTERRLRKLAKQHTEELSTILGRLTEKYDVEVSPPETHADRRMPLRISLRDRNVEVPLDDWGSGTQNRTHILMAILQANRIKTTDSSDDKITPLVVIEEPESFLHPSAQAEFGRMLRDLSDEFGIQIIATTHSPYMLNQEEPAANVLLSRQMQRKKPYNTVILDTAGENWMAPFAGHLGIGASEFTALRPLFSARKSKVLLVEGPLDKEYFAYFQKNASMSENLSDEIEVVPYGGKDTLKNTLLVQFVLRTFDQLFVTFDLDAESEVRAALGRVGLKAGDDYLALGLPQAGKDCIEGLLPQSVLSAVNGRETDLVMKLGSKDNSERRRAKDALKQSYLQEFKSRQDYSKEEVRDLLKVVRQVNARLS